MTSKVVVAAVLMIAAGAAGAQDHSRRIGELLLGVQEVPVVSTTGSGTFRAEISKDEQEIQYTLTFENLEGDVRQAHIHVGPEQNTGAIVLWLCQTPTNQAPAGTNPPQCFDANTPASLRSNSVSGVLTPADVVPQASHGIAAEEFAEVIALIRAGKTYVNVHSAQFPPGEIRSQIRQGGGHGQH